MKSRTFLPILGVALATGFTVADTAETKPAAAPPPPAEVQPAANDAAPAQEQAKPAAKPDAKPAAKAEQTPEQKARAAELESLGVRNKLATERFTNATAKLRNEVARLKLQREAITERMALETAKRNEGMKDQIAKYEEEKAKLAREKDLLALRADKLAAELKTAQQENALRITRMQSQIAQLEAAEKSAQYAAVKPVYLEKPLRDDGVLVISDRRIPLNGTIVSSTANDICSRIDFLNNKDRKQPIFIVIDDCPGGSVMAGTRILKKMEESDAPVHVVVKSFAASMAAVITTLAKESYCYPNAIMLHHQISSSPRSARLNLTQQREFFEESNRWWERMATPVAEKMGLSTDEFIKRMYEKSTSGDWSEFGVEAQKLRWVNHIVQGIEESALSKSPDAKPIAAPAAPAPAQPQPQRGEELVDENGAPYVWLPRLNPKDAYFLYNPDNYYRVR